MTSIEEDWFRIDVYKVNGKDAYDWALENIYGAWCTNRFLKNAFENKFPENNQVNFNWITSGNFPFWFALESDAFAFKLRWI